MDVTKFLAYIEKETERLWKKHNRARRESIKWQHFGGYSALLILRNAYLKGDFDSVP